MPDDHRGSWLRHRSGIGVSYGLCAALLAVTCLSGCSRRGPAVDPAGAGQQQPDSGVAATSAPPDAGSAEPDPAAAEQAAFAAARPVFEQHCARCHTKGGKKAKAKSLRHFDMTTYPFGGHHADEITSRVRKVLGIAGGKVTMPMDDKGAVQGQELELIAAWADAYDRVHPAGAHEGHGPAHDHGDHQPPARAKRPRAPR